MDHILTEENIIEVNKPIDLQGTLKRSMEDSHGK